jgi:hypothetical protein
VWFGGGVVLPCWIEARIFFIRVGHNLEVPLSMGNVLDRRSLWLISLVRYRNLHDTILYIFSNLS